MHGMMRAVAIYRKDACRAMPLRHTPMTRLRGSPPPVYVIIDVCSFFFSLITPSGVIAFFAADTDATPPRCLSPALRLFLMLIFTPVSMPPFLLPRGVFRDDAADAYLPLMPLRAPALPSFMMPPLRLPFTLLILRRAPCCCLFAITFAAITLRVDAHDVCRFTLSAARHASKVLYVLRRDAADVAVYAFMRASAADAIYTAAADLCVLLLLTVILPRRLMPPYATSFIMLY